MADLLALAEDHAAAMLRLNARRRSLLRFYEQFGYFEFPRLSVEIRLTRPPPPTPSTRIRPFTADDAAECAALHNGTGAAYAGSLIWDPGQGVWEHPYRLVCQDGDRITGYAYGGSGFSSVGWLDDATDVLTDLMEGLMRQAVADGETSLEVRLPRDQDAVRALEDGGLSASFRWHNPDEHLNLLCIPDTRPITAALNLPADGADAPEAARRAFGPRRGQAGPTPTSGSEVWGADNLDLTQYPLDRPLPAD